MCSGESKLARRKRRLPSAVEPVVFFVLGLVFSLALIAFCGFAAMVDDNLPDRERYRQMLYNLFLANTFNWLLVIGMAVSAVVCFSIAAILARDVILGARNDSGVLADGKVVFIVALLFIAGVVFIVAYG